MEVSTMILKSFKAILSIHPNLAREIGNTFPLPKFSSEQLISLCNETQPRLTQTLPLLKLTGSFIIVGDLHGSFGDLIRILMTHHLPPEVHYIFLGDYVDRGDYSLETIVLLLALQNIFPEHIHLLRGNHEFMNQCAHCGFLKELNDCGYSNEVFESFISIFVYLPIGALINDKILCIHGGVSPDFVDMNQIADIQFPLLECGADIVGDILWSDPSFDVEDFQKSHRGIGYNFSEKNATDFLEHNNLKAIIRGHECKMSGIEKFGEANVFTVFSASNYCGTAKNHSATLSITADNRFLPRTFPYTNFIPRHKAVFISVEDGVVPEKLIVPEVKKPLNSRMIITSNSLTCLRSITPEPHKLHSLLEKTGEDQQEKQKVAQYKFCKKRHYCNSMVIPHVQLPPIKA